VSATLRSLALGAALVVLAGCGPSGHPVAGDFIADGNPPVAGEKWIVQLTSDNGKSYSGEVIDSKFNILNVPSGTYKVSITHYGDADTGGKAAKRPPTQPTPKAYSDPLTVPGGPYKLQTSKLKK